MWSYGRKQSDPRKAGKSVHRHLWSVGSWNQLCSAPVVGPTPDSVLRSLTQARFVELAREIVVSIPAGREDAQMPQLIADARPPLWAWLGHLVRCELWAARWELGLDAPSRSRTELAGALLEVAGLLRGRQTIPPIFGVASARDAPRRDDIVKRSTPACARCWPGHRFRSSARTPRSFARWRHPQGRSFLPPRRCSAVWSSSPCSS